ncbi:hypothetical protein JR316_0001436 [Psilocybe cubensis]|uniref:F-box domain-containing protein n=2 Tax=Psilocybe cubensis TaxID=181762 RepID=A0A8H7Y9A9_PSICU|nr:hypothetical protein JR316_0001436 [Psilocybe cubensis]KAH9487361.1 hypothetical protein JR316_0001436 [Psilocybe cubensis]
MAMLPLEIVSMVFYNCLPDVDESEPSGECQSAHRQTLFKVGAVCKAWRQTVWNIPGFWRYIPLELGPSNITDTPPIVTSWMERARHIPLSISVFVSHRDCPLSDTGLKNFIRIANLFNTSSSRLENIVLKMPTNLLRLFAAQSPKLKSISIYNNDDEQLIFNNLKEPYKPWVIVSYSERVGLANLNTKPRPSTLSINRVLLKSVHACWDNLVSVDTKDINLEDIFEILRRAPKLREFQIYESRSPPYTLTESIPHVPQNDLESLDIICESAEFLNILFSRISQLPWLTSLMIDVRIGQIDCKCIAELMKRSSCPLDEFVITGPLAADSDVLSMLKAMPYLTYLHISPNNKSDPNYTAKNIFECVSDTTRRRDAEIESEQNNMPSDALLPYLEFLSYFPNGPEDSKMIWDLKNTSNMTGVIQARCPDIDVCRCTIEVEMRPQGPFCIHYLPSG